MKRHGSTPARKHGRRPLSAAVLSVLCVLCASVATYPATAPDPFGERVIAVRARRIETVAKGVVENGVLVVRGGRIAAVGADVKVPVGAKVIEADTVMPGIVAAWSELGLTSGGGDAPPIAPPIGRGGRGGLAGAPSASAVTNPHHRALDEFYPYDPVYRRLLRAGVTTLALAPGGAAIGGQGVAVKPVALQTQQAALVPSALLSMRFSSGTPTQDAIRNALTGARGGPQPGPTPGPGGMRAGGPTPVPRDPDEDDDDFQRRRRPPVDGAPAGPPMPAGGFAAERREPLVKALIGEIPVFVTVPDPAALLYALPLFQPFERIRVVWVLGSDAYRVASILAEKKASVIIPAEVALEPNTRDRINTAAILAKAGLKIACRPPTDSAEGYDNLRFKVAELVKQGLDRETALKAITLHPAEMLGLGARLGSLEVGRDAHLLLLDGDPLGASTRVRKVLVEGEVVYEEP